MGFKTISGERAEGQTGKTEGKLQFNHTLLTHRQAAAPASIAKLHLMKLHADRAEGVNVIHAYTRTSVSVNGQVHTGSLIVPPTGAMLDWPVHSLEGLTDAHFDAVVAARPEVLILGSGQKLRFVSPAILKRLMAERIGVETMDTAAACRTFNILVAEGRQVMAALLIEA
jgi:uncharacterized protein